MVDFTGRGAVVEAVTADAGRVHSQRADLSRPDAVQNLLPTVDTGGIIAAAGGLG
jgi:hypothetical protein